MKKRSISLLLALILISALFFGFSKQTLALKKTTNISTINEPYNGRVFYEIFVRAFNDSNNDGIGDLKGVTQKLDYLKSLGIKGIWLMPINSSPSYHGYDVSDYYSINKDYGTLEDFKELIKEAHRRDIKVEMDMVINHTSTENPWFIAASTNKDDKYRNYYVWTSDKKVAAENSPISTQPWTELGGEYYYSLFWSGMPDLNYDNRDVRDEMKKIGKYYIDMGVDGFRLDAAMWIYTNGEDKNLAWWKEFRDYIKSINKNAVLVGEVWQSAPKLIAPYYKVLDSCFNFPLAESIVMGVQSGTISSVMSNTNYAYEKFKAVNKSFIDSPFLTNHDMNRSMNTLQNVDLAKSAVAILMTLPGTPYIYYGEETGMMGNKPDEQIRQPFIWDNKNKAKNSSWEVSDNDLNRVAVSVQEKDKNSLLNFYKNIINLRNNNNALKLGSFNLINTENNEVAAYRRSYKNDQVYVYINVSKNIVKENIDIKSAKVLYSNVKTAKVINFKGKISLSANQILILEK